jgi:hypothetical protein
MDAKPKKHPETYWRLTSGRLLAGFALVFCVPVGVLFVSVATDAVGIVLGIAGYALGARTRAYSPSCCARWLCSSACSSGRA